MTDHYKQKVLIINLEEVLGLKRQLNKREMLWSQSVQHFFPTLESTSSDQHLTTALGLCYFSIMVIINTTWLEALLCVCVCVRVYKP